jgi:hypothetical protein
MCVALSHVRWSNSGHLLKEKDRLAAVSPKFSLALF